MLFDLDGTLLDTVELIVQSYQHTFRECLNHEVPREEILRNLGLTLPAHLALYVSDPSRVEEMVGVYRAFNLANHDRLARLFPGVAETLAELARSGVPMAVVSSKAKATVLRGLALFDLTSRFKVVVGLEDCERHKPHPEPVLLAADRLGIAADRLLMIGDSPADIEAGRAAGSRTVAVAWSRLPWPDLLASHPDLVLQRMEDLLALPRLI